MLIANQCRSKFWRWSWCQSIPINAHQFLSILIHRNWEELIGIYRHWETFRINAMILIGIDRHWALIGGVLCLVKCNLLPYCHAVKLIRVSIKDLFFLFSAWHDDLKQPYMHTCLRYRHPTLMTVANCSYSRLDEWFYHSTTVSMILWRNKNFLRQALCLDLGHFSPFLGHLGGPGHGFWPFLAYY